jgi:hypothetical protein
MNQNFQFHGIANAGMKSADCAASTGIRNPGVGHLAL